MNWKAKSRYFRALSVIPFGNDLHHLTQRHLTRQWPRPAEHLSSYRRRGEHFAALFQRFSSTAKESATFVEIGAGRDLALALGLRLAGVGRVICIDRDRLAHLDLVNHAGAHLGMPTLFSSWQELENFGISYAAPQDAERTALPDCAVDALCTSEVLEHIPPASLHAIFVESHRILAAGGLHIHAIDHSDHFARSDPSISRFNFLKFSDREWRRHNSRLQYVNRMRHSEYLSLLDSTGFKVVDADVCHGDLPSDIAANLAPEFAGYARHDLTAQRSLVVARKTDRCSY